MAEPLASQTAPHQTLRIATWNVSLDRAGPGLLVNDLARAKDPQIAAILQVLVELQADVVLLTAFDYDKAMVAAQAFNERLTEAGLSYPHLFSLRPNTGVTTGLDMDRDGRLGGAGDAQGWGRFSGQGGMLILSKLAIDRENIRDYSSFLWRDLPDNLMPKDSPQAEVNLQRLSSVGHWQVPLILENKTRLTLLAWHATPPVFDGPEDRNGRRNHDEAAFWARLLDGDLPFVPPSPPFVLLGDSNLDPEDGDGRPQAIRELLSHPRLNDPRPRGTHGRTEPAHRGDPALDTALYDQIGGLRVDLVLPGKEGLETHSSGVFWPRSDTRFSDTLKAASRHAPVWVDVATKHAVEIK